MSEKVDILLATYNGEKFLDEQFRSIFEQEFHDFRIVVRDDGSTDQTLNILAKWKGLYPQKIEIIEDDLKNLGPTQNFNRLMEFSRAPYICFSDQDDKWHPSKLSLQMQKILEVEDNYPDIAVMVFCDLVLCDDQLNIISTSLMEKDRLDETALGPHQLLMQNVPYGCATIINRKLLEIASPIDQRALLHDHWLSIISSLTGKIAFLDEALIYHRVHDSNASRSASEHKKEAAKDLRSKVNNQNFHNYLFKQVDQAQAVLERLHPDLNDEQQSMLRDFISLKTTKGFKRKWLIVKNRFFKNTIYHTIKLIIRA